MYEIHRIALDLSVSLNDFYPVDTEIKLVRSVQSLTFAELPLQVDVV